jgi:hypothetical protein
MLPTLLLTADAGTRAQVREYVQGLLDRCRVVDGIELDRCFVPAVRESGVIEPPLLGS